MITPAAAARETFAAERKCGGVTETDSRTPHEIHDYIQ